MAEALADRSGLKPIPREGAKPSALTRVDTIVILAIVFVAFLFVDGPVWKHAWEPLRSIVYSYAFIPLLVLPVLVFRKRFTGGAWFFESFRIAVMKFLLTAAFLMVCWMFGAAPKPMYGKPALPKAASSSIEGADSVFVVPRDHAVREGALVADGHASIAGVVTRADGSAASNAYVYVSGGLDDLEYAAPKDPIALVDDGAGFHAGDARVIFAQVGRSIDVRSTDGRLHTFLLRRPSAEVLASVPILASGAPRAIVFAEPLGALSLRCAVHEGATPEPEATLVVVAHPFFTRADASGRFTLDRLPARTVRVAAIGFDGAKGADVELTLQDGSSTSTTLTLP